MVAGLFPISWVKLIFYCPVLIFLFISGSILHLKCVGYDWGFHLGGSSSPARIWRSLRLLTLLSACIFFNYAFFYFKFTIVTSCRVSFSTVCTLRYIWVFICFFTCVVIFSATSANCFPSAACFCVPVFVANVTFREPVLVLVYSRIW